MNPLSAPADADLVEKIAEFVDDPLGFVTFAYPWRERGPPLMPLQETSALILPLLESKFRRGTQN